MTWWRLWLGHIWAGVVVLTVGLAVLLLWASVEAETPDAQFILGMCFILAGVLAFCAGAVSAYFWNTKRERIGLRQGTITFGRPIRQTPAGDDRTDK